MSKRKNIEGAIPVNSDVTPITRKKIEQVDASKWHEMTTQQLFDQKVILTERLYQAQMVGNYHIVQQIQKGIQALDALLTQHNIDEDNRLV